MDSKLLEVIAGAAMPVVIDLVNKYVANSTARYVISLVFCLLLGTLFNLDKLNAGDIFTSGAVVFAAAQTMYQTYYSKSNVRATLFGEEMRK